MSTPDYSRYQNEKDIKDADSERAREQNSISDDSSQKDLRAAAVDRSYVQKCEMINACLQEEIGMGRFQWELFVLCGFGWATDNMFFQAVGVILPQVGRELGHDTSLPWMSFAGYVGLVLGCIWAVASDVVGRRPVWYSALFFGSTFGMACGGAPTFAVLGVFVALMAFGTGGNLPVDGALFLEFLPKSHHYLLTMMSAFWAVGVTIASLVGWVFIVNYSCAATDLVCDKSNNMGWRYTMITLGAMVFSFAIIRLFGFQLLESPKWLVSKGRDAEAIMALEHVANRNGKTITLTLERLQSVNTDGEKAPLESISTKEVLALSLRNFNLSHLKPLFRTRHLAINTTMTATIWAFVGLAYPLFNSYLPLFLAQRTSIHGGTINTTYRDYAIHATCGVAGSLCVSMIVGFNHRTKNGYMIGGRKYIIALMTALTGVFMFLFTTAKTNSGVLGYSSAIGFTQNAMYGVIYSYTFEAFPTPHRGTGDALCASANRIFGLMAPIIALYGDLTTHIPIYVSASMFLITSVIALFLPIETVGKEAL